MVIRSRRLVRWAVVPVSVVSVATGLAGAPRATAAPVPHTPLLTFAAGNGTPGLSDGPGRVATGAQLGAATAIGDEHGNLLIADQTNCRIRRVDLAGLVSDV